MAEGLALGSLAYLIATPQDNRQKSVYMFLIFGSLLTSFIGQKYANRYLNEAVDTYNKNGRSTSISDFKFSILPIDRGGGMFSLGGTF